MNIKKYELNPNWITGFVDGDGCFTVRITESKRYKAGWFIQASFQIKLHIKDKDLLLNVKTFFNNAGTIWTNDNFCFYQVRNIDEIINIIVPHFDKYTLITQKRSDYEKVL